MLQPVSTCSSAALTHNSQRLRDSFRSKSSKIVKIRIPYLQQGLPLEPSFVDEKTVNNACLVLLSPSVSRSPYDFVIKDPTMRLCNLLYFELAGHSFFNQVAQSQRDFSYLNRIDCRRDLILLVG